MEEIFNFPTNYSEPTFKFNFPNQDLQTLNNLVHNEAKTLSTVGTFVVSDLLKKIKAPNTSSFDFSSNIDKTKSAYIREKITNITFLPTNYINEFGQVATTPQVVLDLCLIDMDFSQESVETLIMNQNGKIKEVIAGNDSTVNISGAIMGNYQAPTPASPLLGKDTQTIRDLITITQAKVSIKVISAYLDQGNIKKLFIKHLSLPQQSEFYNIQNFQINAVSDDDILYIL